MFSSWLAGGGNGKTGSAAATFAGGGKGKTGSAAATFAGGGNGKTGSAEFAAGLLFAAIKAG
jgi:hypothetical protein